MEPNIVFVYKFKTYKYVTVCEVIKNGGRETFELEHAEQFDTFHHEEHKPLKGRVYYLSQESINMMVEKINEQIYSHHQSHILSGKEDTKKLVNILSFAQILQLTH
jgi:hypothetical protein